MRKTGIEWANMFPGGVPPGDYFGLLVDDIIEMVLDDDRSDSLNKVARVALIGLVAYFEAFCNDLFASLINVAPHLIASLKDKGQDVTIDATALLKHRLDPKHQMGFLLAEKYDFGTAKKINSLFSALLGITPLSKRDAARFSALLHDRHLLVHHGGTFTSRYLDSARPPDMPGLSRVFMDSLPVSSKRVLGEARFLKNLARKMTSASVIAVERSLATLGFLDKSRKHWLFMLSWHDEGGA